MKNISDILFFACIYSLLLMFVIGVKTLLVWGAWSLLVVPVWGAANLSFMQALVLVIMVTILVPTNTDNKNEKQG